MPYQRISILPMLNATGLAVQVIKARGFIRFINFEKAAKIQFFIEYMMTEIAKYNVPFEEGLRECNLSLITYYILHLLYNIVDK